MVVICIYDSPTFSSLHFVDTILEYAKQHPKKSFTILCSQKFQLPSLSDNVSVKNILPPKPSTVLGTLWYKGKFKKLLASLSATQVIHNLPIIPSISSIPQLLWKEYSFSALAKMKNIVVLREKNNGVLWVNALEVPDNFALKLNIHSLPLPITDDYNPLDGDNTAEENAGDIASPYFCLWVNDAVTKEDILTVIKSFSQFKKRMKSSMALVLLSRQKNISKLLPDISTYKYRQDLHIINAATDLEKAERIRSAYAMLLFYSKKDAGMMPFKIMKAAVPLIRIGTEWETYPSDKLFGLASKNTAESIAGHLIRLYQDELLYKQEQQRGLEMCSSHNLQITVEALDKIIKGY